ncbi:MAG: GxxExxY protein [Planctomycetota bacterium]
MSARTKLEGQIESGGFEFALSLGAALTVHTALGPGLLESVYECCLEHELRLRGIRVERQVVVGLDYRGKLLGDGFRIDLLVEGELVVEVKAVETLRPIHEAQLLTYLRLSGSRLGLLLNFNTESLREGIRRRVNGYPSSST